MKIVRMWGKTHMNELHVKFQVAFYEGNPTTYFFVSCKINFTTLQLRTTK